MKKNKPKFKVGDVVYMMSEIGEPIACEIINVYSDPDDDYYVVSYEARDIDNGDFFDGTEEEEFSEAFTDVGKFVRHYTKKLKEFAKKIKEENR